MVATTSTTCIIHVKSRTTMLKNSSGNLRSTNIKYWLNLFIKLPVSMLLIVTYVASSIAVRSFRCRPTQDVGTTLSRRCLQPSVN
jgi:hypothetical protein